MKIQKLALAVLAIGTLACGFFSNEAQAVLINGNIQFNGSADLDSDALASATRVDAYTDVSVSSRSGDFTSVPILTPVAMSAPWSFNSGAIPNFWTVGTFTFDLTNSAVSQQLTNLLFVTGTGTVRSTTPGLDPTPAIYTFSITSSDGTTPGGIYGFSASTAARGVPEGVSALALLGIAFAGIELGRRKLFAR